MQTLFAFSEEGDGLVPGLGVVPSNITLFDVPGLAVPHMGWNGINVRKPNALLAPNTADKFYFVHSYLALPTPGNQEWILTTTNYGVEYVSAICKGNVIATQFHPEKSGKAGLALLRQFLSLPDLLSAPHLPGDIQPQPAPTQLAPRVIACLDVRANDQGDLVVTKGDQ
jgi:glutamine amidotransferase/cyclase